MVAIANESVRRAGILVWCCMVSLNLLRNDVLGNYVKQGRGRPINRYAAKLTEMSASLPRCQWPIGVNPIELGQRAQRFKGGGD